MKKSMESESVWSSVSFKKKVNKVHFKDWYMVRFNC